MADLQHDTFQNTGVAFFHGIPDINLDSVNPVKRNINGNMSNMERSKLKKDFMFCCGELSIYIWLICLWTITHQVASSLRPQLKGRCQDQSKIKSRKSIVIKPPFLGVPESEVKGQHELAEGWSDMSWQGTDQGWNHIVGGETKHEQMWCCREEITDCYWC